MPLTFALLLEASNLPVGPFWRTGAESCSHPFRLLLSTPFNMKEESSSPFRSDLCETCWQFALMKLKGRGRPPNDGGRGLFILLSSSQR